MNRRFAPVCVVCVIGVLAGCTPNGAPSAAPAHAPSATLTPFGSEEAFTRYQQQMERDWQARVRKRPPYGSYPRQPEPPRMGHPPPRGEPVDATQPAGLHEPGIVKATRDHLVILRRNRLHTLHIAGGALDTVASIDALAPGTPQYEANAEGIVVSGDVVAVIGTGARGMAVQVGWFRVDTAGGLAYLGTHQLRSGGGETPPIVRLVDGKLAVFAPLSIWPGDPNGFARYLPAVRRWEPARGDTAWTPLVEPGRIYRPAGRLRADDGTTLHALTVCDPARGTLDCRATVVYAPRAIAQHVSRTAAYVWTTQWRGHDDESNVPDRSVLYRIPLDGGAPAAVEAKGHAHTVEETADGKVDVLLDGGRLPADRAPAGWNPVVLLRVPTDAFGDGSGTVGENAYHGFANPGSTTLQARFTGDGLVYGTERENGAYGTYEESRAFAARRDGAGEAVPLPLAGALVGLDAMGSGAVVTSTTGDSLRYQPVGPGAAAGAPFSRRIEHAWEVDAHAVVHHPIRADTGVLGIARSGFGYTPSVLFVRHDAAGLGRMGELGATVPPGTECRECGGYFDFALPVFLRGRILALVGGEMVEAVMEGEGIRELRRIRFAPPALSAP
jgi:hypothetical protein